MGTWARWSVVLVGLWAGSGFGAIYRGVDDTAPLLDLTGLTFDGTGVANGHDAGAPAGTPLSQSAFLDGAPQSHWNGTSSPIEIEGTWCEVTPLPAVWTMDLQRTCALYGMTLYGNAGNGYWGMCWTTIDVSTDNTTWTRAGQTPGVRYETGTMSGAWTQDAGIPAGTLARYIRITAYNWFWSGSAKLDQFDLFAVSPVTVTGTVDLSNYVGDTDLVGVQVELKQDGVVRRSEKVLLTDNGTFTLTGVWPGVYDVTVRAYASLGAVLRNVIVSDDPTVLGPVVLQGGDSNGDDQVSFEDFAILQNTYGRHGPILVPHVVDGVCSPGEWGTLYTDPVGDTCGDVELIRWGAEVRDGVLYAAFELDPNGPTVAQYNDPANGKNIWLSLWLDVDPAADPMTGVPEGDSQFAPRTQDIYIELGTDQGTLEGWQSLNFWGHSDNFSKSVPVTGSFAYSDYIVEFSCPVSAILAELPNTDGAVPASVWKVAARAAGQGFGGDYSGDITDLKSLGVSDTQGGTPQANPLVPAAAATGGCGALGAVLILMVGLAMAWWNRE